MIEKILFRPRDTSDAELRMLAKKIKQRIDAQRAAAGHAPDRGSHEGQREDDDVEGD